MRQTTNHRHGGSGLVEGQEGGDIDKESNLSLQGPFGVASPTTINSLLRLPFGPCAFDQAELEMAWEPSTPPYPN
ncbi:MAG: hypothetical protein Q9180_002602, partial [Flavoplaca navasiana]